MTERETDGEGQASRCGEANRKTPAQASSRTGSNGEERNDAGARAFPQTQGPSGARAWFHFRSGCPTLSFVAAPRQETVSSAQRSRPVSVLMVDSWSPTGRHASCAARGPCGARKRARSSCRDSPPPQGSARFARCALGLCSVALPALFSTMEPSAAQRRNRTIQFGAPPSGSPPFGIMARQPGPWPSCPTSLRTRAA